MGLVCTHDGFGDLETLGLVNRLIEMEAFFLEDDFLELAPIAGVETVCTDNDFEGAGRISRTRLFTCNGFVGRDAA